MNKNLVINGWHLLAHPIFLEQLNTLIEQVEKLKEQCEETYKTKNATKRLAAIAKLSFEIIPQDPTRSVYRQGHTLGDEHKHWLRAKFFQQYRLFFRYHQESKIIIYAWINDEKTKRAYKNKMDAYSIFKKMLDQGNPPSDWKTLLKESKPYHPYNG